MSVEAFRPSPDISEDALFSLLWFPVDHPQTWFGFGYPRAHGSFKSYLMTDPETDDWEIWTTNQWMHLCLSYRKEDGWLKVIKVSVG